MKNKSTFIEWFKFLKFNQVFIPFLLSLNCCNAMGQIIAANSSFVMNSAGNRSVPMYGMENITPIGSFSIYKGFASADPIVWKMEITPTGYHHAYLANKFAPMIGINYVHRPKVTETELRKFYLMTCGFKYSHERFIGGMEYGVQPVGNHQKFLTFHLGYVIGLTHDCLKKRIHGQYMNRFMEL